MVGRACTNPVPLRSLQLRHDRSRVEEYLRQSMGYLKNTQAALRAAAIRFISESPPRGPFSGSLAPVPAVALAGRGSPVAARAPAALCQAPHAGGLAGSLAQSHRPPAMSCSGVSPAEGEEGMQPSRQGRGPCCWGCAGEQRPDRSSVPRACHAAREEPEQEGGVEYWQW